MRSGKIFIGAAVSLFFFACRREIPIPHTAAQAEELALVSVAVATNSLSGQPSIPPVAASTVRLIAGGPNTQVLVEPSGLASRGDSLLYVVDDAANQIKLVSKRTGQVIRTFGDGTPGYADGNPATAHFKNPTCIALGPDGTLFIADRGNCRIRTISPNGNSVGTLAGSGVPGFADGVGTLAKFNLPTGITVDKAGTIYIADEGNNMIRRITSGNHVSRWAGQLTAGYKDDTGSHAAFNNPVAVAVLPGGGLYVADLDNFRIRKIIGGVVSTFAGSGNRTRTDGVGVAAGFAFPSGIATDSTGNIYVADGVGNDAIRMIDPAGNVKSITSQVPISNIGGITVDPKGGIFISDAVMPGILSLGFLPGVQTLPLTFDGLGFGAQIAFAPDGTLYIMNQDGSLLKVNVTTNTVTEIANGFNHGSGIACDAAGNIIVMQGEQIRKISPTGGFVSIVATLNSFIDNPCIDGAGNIYVISTCQGETVFKISPAGVVTTITSPFVDTYQYKALGSSFAWFREANPIWTSLAVDRSTGNFYVGCGNTLYRMTPDGKTLTPVLGGVRSDTPPTAFGSPVLSNGNIVHTRGLFNDPTFRFTGITCNAKGKVYLANSGFDPSMGFMGFDDQDRFYNIVFLNPGEDFERFTFEEDFTKGDASGPDIDGPVSSDNTKTGEPWSPALSPDGKILYFVSLQPTTNGIVIRKVSAP